MPFLKQLLENHGNELETEGSAPDIVSKRMRSLPAKRSKSSSPISKKKLLQVQQVSPNIAVQDSQESDLFAPTTIDLKVILKQLSDLRFKLDDLLSADASSRLSEKADHQKSPLLTRQQFLSFIEDQEKIAGGFYSAWLNQARNWKKYLPDQAYHLYCDLYAAGLV